MAEDRRLTEQRDRDGHVEASEVRRHLDVMNVAAPIPSQTSSTVAPDPGIASQVSGPNDAPPPADYDG
jgi:hypothetical protein